jgi:hypothetical protein
MGSVRFGLFGCLCWVCIDKDMDGCEIRRQDSEKGARVDEDQSQFEAAAQEDNCRSDCWAWVRGPWCVQEQPLALTTGMPADILGFTTMSIGPIFTRILYSDTFSTSWFAYAWVVVFAAAFFAVALCVPAATLFFSTIHWCCWHDRKILPGQAVYEDDSDAEDADPEKGEVRPLRGRSPPAAESSHPAALVPGNSLNHTGHASRLSLSKMYYDGRQSLLLDARASRIGSVRSSSQPAISWTRLGALYSTPE